jgi:tetratricopeptide (TPR) repeat protein
MRKILAVAVVAAVVASVASASSERVEAEYFDPVLEPGAFCTPGGSGGKPALLKNLVLARTETAPFQPVAPQPVLSERPVLYRDLGKLHFPVRTREPAARPWFEQGMLLAYGFNHAEAQRAFREAQRLDPECALCFWGEALVLGPNINAPMRPEAVAPAMAALARARELSARAPARERALIEALATRYSADPAADRASLDRAYADAMREVARRHPSDDNVRVLFAEALMDTQPWDYWEAGGAKPKGAGAEIVAQLEAVLARNPRHAGAAHYYIHAMEASTQVAKALPHARRLAGLAPGAGHLVHMPAHVYFRLGMYRESLEANKRAIAADDRYFRTSPSDPLYRFAYYPHNIHFVMVSAQMGGDRTTALEAARRLDASIAPEVAAQFPIMQPVKAAPYTTHALFSDADEILALPAPPAELTLVKAMYHYARAVARAQRLDAGGARVELDALAAMEAGDFAAFTEWGVPAKDIIRTARLVGSARLADARGDLAGAAKAYEEAIAIEDSLAYMEPPYWNYPIRQSLGSVRMRQGRLDDAERAFRDSLARVRNNGFALAGLAETYRIQGKAKAERATRAAMAKAWLGPRGGPDLSRL